MPTDPPDTAAERDRRLDRDKIIDLAFDPRLDPSVRRVARMMLLADECCPACRGTGSRANG